MAAMGPMFRFMPAGTNPLELMVCDYVKSFELQESPDFKVLTEAIMLAVEHGEFSLSLTLLLSHFLLSLPPPVSFCNS